MSKKRNKKNKTPDQTESTVKRAEKYSWLGRWSFRALVFVFVLVGLLSLRADTLWVKYVHMRAKGLFQKYRDQEAIELLRTALAIDSENPNTHLRLAQGYRRQEELRKAHGYLGTASLMGAPKNLITLEEKLTYVQSGRMREANSTTSQLLVEHSEQGQDILQAFVVGLLVNQNPADALRLLEKWREAFPSDSKACYYTGVIFTDYRKLPEAIEQFRNGLRFSPGDVEMHAELINVLMENDMGKEAYESIQEGKKRRPNESKFIFAEAQYFLAQQDFQRTRELAQRCILDAPNSKEARLLLGRALFELEQFEQAASELQSVVEREPTNTLARELMGKCLQRLGFNVAASQHFDFVSQSVRAQNEIHRLSRKMQDEPQNVELRFEIAQLANKFVSREDAAKWMHMVLEIQPGHTGALSGLVDYYDSIGETARVRDLKKHIRVLKDAP